MTFAALLVTQKREKKKSYFMFLYGGSKPPPYDIKPSIANRKSKKYVLHPVSAHIRVTPAPLFQRACKLACTNLLGFLV